MEDVEMEEDHKVGINSLTFISKLIYSNSHKNILINESWIFVDWRLIRVLQNVKGKELLINIWNFLEPTNGRRL